MPDFAHMTIPEMLDPKGYDCAVCGRHHDTAIRHVEIGAGAINKVPELMKKYGGTRPLVIADKNTFAAAGEKLCAVLEQAGVAYSTFVFPQEDKLEPDEHSVGQVVMTFDVRCDFIIAVGTGTINDIAKIVAACARVRYIIVGTAPSMDGYASNSSSMIVAGIKTSLYSTCPVAILADTDIIRQAPMRMVQAGLGDIVAKYVSICEWRISNIVNDEYYCEDIAELVRAAVKKCVDNADGLLRRDPAAVEAVVEGLIFSGVSMSYAGSSRPASGLEHYFSHIWDMRSLESGSPSDLHGIQVGVGTVLTLRLYDWIRDVTPDRARALAHAHAHDRAAWEKEMHRIFGKSAENIIRIEDTCGKNDAAKLPPRLDKIIDHWDEIQAAIREELPTAEKLEGILKGIGAPVLPEELGLSKEETRDALMASKEIRDKYIASRLLWDLGILDEMADRLIDSL